MSATTCNTSISQEEAVDSTIRYKIQVELYQETSSFAPEEV